jgi:Bacterial Ig-like domain (group 3)
MNWLTRWICPSGRAANVSRNSVAIRPCIESLEDRSVPAVLNYGGNVLPHVEAQALFLGNEWSTVPAYIAQAGTINQFLPNITGGAYMDALTLAGYGVGRGTASPGPVDNSTITIISTITDASIQRSLQADIRSGALKPPDANRLYIVYVEPNVAVNLGSGQGTTQQGILGYHGAFAGQDAAGSPATIRYAVIAYPGGSVGNSGLGIAAIDQLTSVTSHELAEAVTDPDVNFGQLGWYDPRRGEIGDITESNPKSLVRLNNYLVQEVADRNDQLLSITVSPPTMPPPTTPPTSPPTSPPVTPPTTGVKTTTTITAGPVAYHWYSPPTVALTVTISSGSGAVAPDGTVELKVNGSVLATARVHIVNGVATATFIVEFLGPGTFAFTANYRGSSQFQGSSTNHPVTFVAG